MFIFTVNNLTIFYYIHNENLLEVVTKFTTPLRINAPLSPINEELLDATLTGQQAKYDQGYMALVDSVNKYNSLDLVRQEDIEYRDRKVQELVSKLDGYGNVDFSDAKNVVKLQMEAQSLANDKDLMSRVANTKNYRRLVERYQTLKEDPKRLPYYSDVNEWNDMQIANAWLEGKSSNMPLSSPTLKVDKDKLAGDAMKTLAPRTFSYSNGMYMVNGEIRSEGDLRQIALNTLQSNPQMQAQMMRDAQYLYRNSSPQEIYEQAMSTQVDEITSHRQSLLAYQNQLKDATITGEQKASIEARVRELEGNIVQAEQRYRDTSEKFSKGDVSDLESLKYTTYANNWIKSATQPYIIQREKRTADNAAIAVARMQHDSQKLTTQMEFQAQQNALDRQLKAQAEENDLTIAANKLGFEIDKENYRRTGEVSLLPTGGTAGLANAYYQLPVLQGSDASVDALAEISTKSQQYKNENRQLLSKMTVDILKDTDRDLLTKIKPLLDKGNLFDDNGKFLGDSQGISPAQVQMLKQYDELLDNAANPATIKSNPLLSKYGQFKNLLTENQIKWEALDKERVDATREVFNDAWKKGEFKGTWNEFQKVLNGEVISTARQKDETPTSAKVAEGMSNNVGGYQASTGKFISRINAKLNGSSRKNEFMTARAVAPEDKIYNDESSSMYTKVREYAFKNGAIINGVYMSINGSVQGGKSYRDDVGNVDKIIVRGIVPNSDRIEVDLMQRIDPEKKETKAVRATIQLNPEEMRGIIGRNSETPMTQNFGNSLRNGKMEDSFGNPMYFNLNGDVPNMLGNLQYRVWQFDDEMSVSIKLPGLTEVNLRGVSFTGENSLQDVKASMAKLYTDTKKSIMAQPESDKLAPEEIEAAVLQTIYNHFNSGKQ